jgi:hypothetical protein
MKNFLIAASAFILFGCSGLQRIDQNEFESLTSVQQPKLISTRLIGKTNKNIYIEKLTKRLVNPGWDVNVYWIPIDELSEQQKEMVESLEEYSTEIK